MYFETHLGHDDGSSGFIELRSSGSTDHLKDLRRRILLAVTAGYHLRGGFDDDQMGRQIDS